MSDILLDGGELLEGAATDFLRVWRLASDMARENGGRRGLQMSWRLVYPRGHRHMQGSSTDDAVGSAILDAIANYVERHKGIWMQQSNGAKRTDTLRHRDPKPDGRNTCVIGLRTQTAGFDACSWQGTSTKGSSQGQRQIASVMQCYRDTCCLIVLIDVCNACT